MTHGVAGIKFLDAANRNERMSPIASLIETMFSSSLFYSKKALPEATAKKPNSLGLVTPESTKVFAKNGGRGINVLNSKFISSELESFETFRNPSADSVFHKSSLLGHFTILLSLKILLLSKSAWASAFQPYKATLDLKFDPIPPETSCA